MKKVLIFAAAFALCACDTVNTVERAQPAASRKMVDDVRIVTDSAVDDYAYVAGVNESRAPGGLLKVQAEIVNRSSAYRNVNYKFEWFGADGMQANSQNSVWITLPIEGGESRTVSAVAPNKNVADFKLKLMPDVRD